MTLVPLLALGQGLIPLMAIGGAAFVSILIGAVWRRSEAPPERKRGEIFLWCGFGLVVVTLMFWPLLAKML